MSATVDRKTIITTAKGDTFQVEASDKIENVTHAKVQCDGPKCPTRHNSEVPVNFEFCQEDVAKDLDAYPEVGDYFLSVVIPPRSPSFKDGAPLAFCGRECLRDFFQYEYIAPPPRPVRKVDKRSDIINYEGDTSLSPVINGKFTNKADKHPGYETPDGGHVSCEEVVAPELAYQKGLQKVEALAEKITPENRHGEIGLPSAEDLDRASQLAKRMQLTDAMNQQNIMDTTFSGNPSQADLDLAVKEAIPGVTAAVSDATGYAEGE